MDIRRYIFIRTKRKQAGTGYFVNANRVLTAAHIVHGVEKAWLQYDQDEEKNLRIEANVVWRDEALDAAVLACRTDLDVDDAVLEIEPLAADEEMSSRGWPGAVKTPARFDSDTLGSLTAVTGKACAFAPGAPHFELLIEATIELSRESSKIGWKGVSGASVFCGNRLVGLVKNGRKIFKGKRIQAVPISTLWTAQGFREALGPPYAAQGFSSKDVSQRIVFELQQAADELDEETRRYQELRAELKDTKEIQEKILRLKRRLREGARLSRGDLLDERFKLIKEIGHGGFAQVWLAYDRKGDEEVAVKILHGQHTKDLTLKERFFRGAKQMAKLRHPGIVQVIEPELQDGVLWFFVMEYLPGGDLHKSILSGDLDLDTRLRILAEVGEALSFAHSHKLVHRDVKPANILLDSEGRAKLTDFDLVRAEDTTGGTRRTQAMGTVIFAAPELMEHAATADHRADVYGLAATSIFVLRGKPLKYKEMTRKYEDVVKMLDVPSACHDVLLRGIEWEIEDRPASVREFCIAFDESFGPRQGTTSQEVPEPIGEYSEESSSVVVDTVTSKLVIDEFKKSAARNKKQLEANLSAEVREAEPASSFFPSLAKSQLARRAIALVGIVATFFLVDKRFWPISLDEAVTSKNLGMNFVLIKAGTFTMGSPLTEAGRGHDEEQRKVTLKYDFWLSTTEVTRRQYEELIGSLPADNWNCGECPVVNINWDEAVAFANQLSMGEGLEICYEDLGERFKVKAPACNGYRLPTEEEWEYAARAGTTGARYSDDLDSIAWYSRTSRGEAGVKPVEQKIANAWGLYDMLGNAWEWTETAQGENRVIRGGWWNSDTHEVRAAIRVSDAPSNYWTNLGFRLARGHNLPQQETESLDKQSEE